VVDGGSFEGSRSPRESRYVALLPTEGPFKFSSIVSCWPDISKRDNWIDKHSWQLQAIRLVCHEVGRCLYLYEGDANVDPIKMRAELKDLSVLVMGIEYFELRYHCHDGTSKEYREQTPLEKTVATQLNKLLRLLEHYGGVAQPRGHYRNLSTAISEAGETQAH
jgi:hypothetical protein